MTYLIQVILLPLLVEMEPLLLPGLRHIFWSTRQHGSARNVIKGDFERRRLEKMQLGIYSLLMGVEQIKL